jgi:acyl-CoA thioesterase FadM
VTHVHGERLSDKAVRTTVFIVNDTTDRLACTFTSVAVHVDLGSRRSAPMGPVLLDRVRALTGG